MKLGPSVIVLAAIVAALRANAHACSVAGPGPYMIDAAMQATDHVAPTLGPLAIAGLHRGEKTTGCMEANSCDGIGWLTINVAVSDDVTPANGVGYRFSIVAGTLPPSFSILLDQPTQVPASDGALSFSWDDGTDDHQPIDFTLQVTAIDRAGNESAPQTLRVTDDPGGCAIAGPGSHARALAWVVAAAFVLRNRSRRR